MSKTIDLKQIDKTGEPIAIDVLLEIRREDLDHDDIEAIGESKIVGTAAKGALPGEYVVEGTFSFTADLNCSRCLEPVPFANTSGFAVRFRPHPAVVAIEGEEPEIEIVEGDLDVEYYAEPVVSLEQLAIEQIELALPMKVLCSESCLGLCPKCGANRARTVCGCAENVVDDRWQSLSALRDELKKNDH